MDSMRMAANGCLMAVTGLTYAQGLTVLMSCVDILLSELPEAERLQAQQTIASQLVEVPAQEVQ